jgi:hypothetical protein
MFSDAVSKAFRAHVISGDGVSDILVTPLWRKRNNRAIASGGQRP